MDHATCGHMILDGIKKQAERAIMIKLVNSAPPKLLLHFLLPGSCLEFLPQLLFIFFTKVAFLANILSQQKKTKTEYNLLNVAFFNQYTGFKIHLIINNLLLSIFNYLLAVNCMDELFFWLFRSRMTLASFPKHICNISKTTIIFCVHIFNFDCYYFIYNSYTFVRLGASYDYV